MKLSQGLQGCSTLQSPTGALGDPQIVPDPHVNLLTASATILGRYSLLVTTVTTPFSPTVAEMQTVATCRPRALVLMGLLPPPWSCRSYTAFPVHRAGAGPSTSYPDSSPSALGSVVQRRSTTMPPSDSPEHKSDCITCQSNVLWKLCPSITSSLKWKG